MTVARYRAVLAYDGTRYYGFQRQAGDTPTIQGAVESALARVTGQQVTITGAGRTDTGVHATGQVIAFDVAWRHTAYDLWRALNANLPDDVALQTLDVADPAFHPRFDARSRAYIYHLYVAPVRQPLLNGHAWHLALRQPPDLAAMQAAASVLLGEHDFGAFGSPPQGENTVRRVFRSAITGEGGDPPQVRYEVEANAFLYRMVRRLVNALVQVGTGRLTLDDFEVAFRAADAGWPNPPAPPQGLCLVKVSY